MEHMVGFECRGGSRFVHVTIHISSLQPEVTPPSKSLNHKG